MSSERVVNESEFRVRDVPFHLLVQALTALEQRPKHRKEILTKLFDKTIRRNAKEDAFPLMRLLLPVRDVRMYSIRESMLAKLFAEAMGIPPHADSKDYIALTQYKRPTDAAGAGGVARRQGDFSLALEEVVARRQGSRATTLGSRSTRHTVGTINQVLDKLSKASTTFVSPNLADESKSSSYGRAQLLRDEIFAQLSPSEHKWFARIILKDLKIGGHDTIFKVFHPDALEIFNSTGSLEEVCREISEQTHLSEMINESEKDAENEGGEQKGNLERVTKTDLKGLASRSEDALSAQARHQITPFMRPQPMLCALETNWDGLLKSLRYKPFVMQDKFDGERILIHMNLDAPAYAPSTKQMEKVQISTRRSKDYTAKYGPIFAPLIERIFGASCKSLVLDGEMLAYNRKLRRIEAFGNNRTVALQFGTGGPERSSGHSSRTSNLHINSKDFHLCYVIFDILCIDNRDISQDPYASRRLLLQRLLKDRSTGEPLIVPTVLEICPETIFIPPTCLSGFMKGAIQKAISQQASSGWDNNLQKQIVELPVNELSNLTPDFFGPKILSGDRLSEQKLPRILSSLPIDAGCGVSMAPSTHGLRRDSDELMSKKRVMLATPAALQAMLQDAVSRNMEGLVAKQLDAEYSFGKRGPLWVKIKPDHLGLSDDIDVLVVGGYYGEGRRGGDVASFLLAVRAANITAEERNRRSSENSNSGSNAIHKEDVPNYYTFSKVGSGFSDIEIKLLRDRLRPHWFKSDVIPNYILHGQNANPGKFEMPDVWILPQHSVVFELRFYELKDDSDSMLSGITARFPRFLRLRTDKPWWDSATMDELKACLDRQKVVRRIPGNPLLKGSDVMNSDGNIGQVSDLLMGRKRRYDNEIDDAKSTRGQKRVELQLLVNTDSNSKAKNSERDDEQMILRHLFGNNNSGDLASKNLSPRIAVNRSPSPITDYQPPMKSPISSPHYPTSSFGKDASNQVSTGLELHIQKIMHNQQGERDLSLISDTPKTTRVSGFRRSPFQLISDFQPVEVEDIFQGSGKQGLAPAPIRSDENEPAIDHVQLIKSSHSPENDLLGSRWLHSSIVAATRLTGSESGSIRESALSCIRRVILNDTQISDDIGGDYVSLTDTRRSLDDVFLNISKQSLYPVISDVVRILNGSSSKEIIDSILYNEVNRDMNDTTSKSKVIRDTKKEKADIADAFEKFLKSQNTHIKEEYEPLSNRPSIQSSFKQESTDPLDIKAGSLTTHGSSEPFNLSMPIIIPSLARLSSDVLDDIERRVDMDFDESTGIKLSEKQSLDEEKVTTQSPYTYIKEYESHNKRTSMQQDKPEKKHGSEGDLGRENILKQFRNSLSLCKLDQPLYSVLHHSTNIEGLSNETLRAQSLVSFASDSSAFFERMSKQIETVALSKSRKEAFVASNIFSNQTFCVIGDFLVDIPSGYDFKTLSGAPITASSFHTGKAADHIQLVEVSGQAVDYSFHTHRRSIKLTSKQLSSLIVANSGTVVMSPPSLAPGKFCTQIKIIGETASSRLTPHLRPIWSSLSESDKKFILDSACTQGEFTKVGSQGRSTLSNDEKIRIGQRTVVVGQWIIDSLICRRVAPLVPQYIIQSIPNHFCLIKRQFDSSGIAFFALPIRTFQLLKKVAEENIPSGSLNERALSAGISSIDSNGLSSLIIHRLNGVDSSFNSFSEPYDKTEKLSDSVLNVTRMVFSAFERLSFLVSMSDSTAAASTVIPDEAIIQESDEEKFYSVSTHAAPSESDCGLMRHIIDHWERIDWRSMSNLTGKAKKRVDQSLDEYFSNCVDKGSSKYSSRLKYFVREFNFSHPLIENLIKPFNGYSNLRSKTGDNDKPTLTLADILKEVSETVHSLDPFISRLEKQSSYRKAETEYNLGVARAVRTSAEDLGINVPTGLSLGELGDVSTLFHPLSSLDEDLNPTSKHMEITSSSGGVDQRYRNMDPPSIVPTSQKSKVVNSVYLRKVAEIDLSSNLNNSTSIVNQGKPNIQGTSWSELALSNRSTEEAWTNALSLNVGQSSRSTKMEHTKYSVLMSSLRSILLLPLINPVLRLSQITSPPCLGTALFLLLDVVASIISNKFKLFALLDQSKSSQRSEESLKRVKADSIASLFWMFSLTAVLDSLSQSQSSSLFITKDLPLKVLSIFEGLSIWPVELSPWRANIARLSRFSLHPKDVYANFPITALSLHYGDLSSGARVLAMVLGALPLSILSEIPDFLSYENNSIMQ